MGPRGCPSSQSLQASTSHITRRPDRYVRCCGVASSKTLSGTFIPWTGLRFHRILGAAVSRLCEAGVWLPTLPASQHFASRDNATAAGRACPLAVARRYIELLVPCTLVLESVPCRSKHQVLSRYDDRQSPSIFPMELQVWGYEYQRGTISKIP